MSPQERDLVLESLRAALESCPEVLEACLFGSLARIEAAHRRRIAAGELGK